MEKNLIDAAKLICAAKSVVISTHVMPDGDGLGAEIALYHYLNRLGKKVRILNPDAIPERYLFLDRSGAIETIESSSRKDADFDLAIVVDTNDHTRLGEVWSYFEKKAENILFFDHHPDLESSPKEGRRSQRVHTVVDVKSSSIGELLYRMFNMAHDILDPEASSFRLSPEIALGLYVSIITDTNSFRYSRTTALSHRIAADLVDYGLQPEEIYQNIYSSKSVDHLRLIGEVLSQVNEVPFDKKNGTTISWVEIPRAVRRRYGASSDDTQTIVNFLLLLKNAEILVLLREEDDGRIKASMKSKGNLKINHVAEEFGGGGHDFAAGFSVEGNLPSVRDKLIARLKQLKR